MVKPAEADIVSPAVAADNPNGFLNQVIGKVVKLFGFLGRHHRQFGAQSLNIVALCVNFRIGALRVREDFLRRVAEFAFQIFQQSFGCRRLLVNREAHTEPKFRIVFKQRVRPGRPMPFFVFGIRRRRQVAGVDGRTSGRVGHNHAVAEQLRQQLDVRRFAATRTRAGKFKQRLNELGCLRQVLRHICPLDIRQSFKELPVGHFGVNMLFNMIHIDSLLLRIGLVLRRTGGNADTAAGAVFRRQLQDKFLAGKFLAFVVGALQGCRRISEFFVRRNFHTDNPVRTNNGAFAALDTGFRIPYRNFGRDTALFVLRRRCRPGSVRHVGKSGNRQFFAASGNNFARNFLDKFRSIRRHRQSGV